MINHPARVPISRPLNQLKGAHNRSAPIYLGGPVDVSTVLALLRAASQPDGARRVMGDVYLVSTRPLLERRWPRARAPVSSAPA
jgi:putative AlgH/UPF0301 family transcriptional regulator